MSTHRRWSNASIVLLVCSWIASVWLTGTAADVAAIVLVPAMLGAAVAAVFTWFASTQRGTPPTDQDAVPPPEHRRPLLLLSLAPLALCALGALTRSVAEGALWGKVAMTCIALALGRCSSRPTCTGRG